MQGTRHTVAVGAFPILFPAPIPITLSLPPSLSFSPSPSSSPSHLSTLLHLIAPGAIGTIHAQHSAGCWMAHQ